MHLLKWRIYTVGSHSSELQLSKHIGYLNAYSNATPYRQGRVVTKVKLIQSEPPHEKCYSMHRKPSNGLRMFVCILALATYTAFRSHHTLATVAWCCSSLHIQFVPHGLALFLSYFSYPNTLWSQRVG